MNIQVDKRQANHVFDNCILLQIKICDQIYENQFKSHTPCEVKPSLSNNDYEPSLNYSNNQGQHHCQMFTSLLLLKLCF